MPAVSWIGDTVDRRVERPLSAVGAASSIDDVVEELVAARSTWRRADVVKHVARYVPDTTLADADDARRWIEATADAGARPPRVVALDRPGAGAARRRCAAATASRCYDRHGAARYTHPATRSPSSSASSTSPTPAAAPAAASPTRHAVEQRRHAGRTRRGPGRRRAHRDAIGGDTVVCVVGPAGAGKSRTMRRRRRRLARQRHPACAGSPCPPSPPGCSPPRPAIPADTIAKFLHEHDRPADPQPAWRLRRGEVVVVDEAAHGRQP